MKQFVSKIWNSPSARNVGKLLSSNIIAQAIGLLVYPVLTRMYSPEDFGLLNLFLSIGGALVILSTLEWYNAIVLPKSDEDAVAIVHLSFFTLLALTLLIVFSVPFADSIANLFKAPDIALYYCFLPLYVFLFGLWNILNYWFIRNQLYGRISGFQVILSLFSAGYKIGFARLPFSGGLMYASFLSPLCSLCLTIFLSVKQLCSLLKLNLALCKKVAVTYANFPKFSAPRALLNNISGNLPILILSSVFGLAEIGYIGMAFSLALLPTQIIVRSIYQVQYQFITERVNNKQHIHSFVKKYIYTAALVIIPAFCILYIILPWLTTFFLGDSWYKTGEYIRILLPWIIMIILTTSINFIPDIFGKQRILLWVEILYLLLRISALLIGVYTSSIVLSLLMFSIMGCVVLFGQLIWFITLTYKYDSFIHADNS